MIKRLFLLTTLSVLLSGCFMAPLALIGPGYTTTSIIQSGLTSGANYMVKKSTGKSIAQHALAALKTDMIKQSYFPKY